MDKPKLLDVVNGTVAALEPFTPDERKRIIKAALTVLGDEQTAPEPAKPAADAPAAGLENISAAAQRWMKSFSITREELEQVFQIENGSATVLNVELPGSKKRTNTHSTYILGALAGFISTGDPTVDDKSARALCETLGCYDSANHAVTMANIGNVMNGSKGQGYKLSAPGLREGANLVKRLGGVKA